MNQKKSEQNKVDGMKKGVDSTSEVMNKRVHYMYHQRKCVLDAAAEQ